MLDDAQRVRGERVQWANALKLGGLLARRLRPGTLSDPLSGLKGMTTAQLGEAVDLFASDVKRVAAFKQGQLRQAVRPASDVQAHINSKFVMDGAFMGRFASLDDFYRGPEARIGAPNPQIRKGMDKEHCLRANATNPFVSSNYNLFTWPRQEWEFVVGPVPGYEYPHTPQERERWPAGVEWRGGHGREVNIHPGERRSRVHAHTVSSTILCRARARARARTHKYC